MAHKKLIPISELLSGLQAACQHASDIAHLKAYILHHIDDDLPDAISSDVRQQFDNGDK